MPFIPHTEDDVRAMLAAIGVDSIGALFDEIPPVLDSARTLGDEAGLSEAQVMRLVASRAARNGRYSNFIGAGAYEHHVPAAVWQIATRGEFYSAYTPYQAEASQGTLQVLYEYQSMMTALTGLPVANASLYDGASALGEAVLMAVRSHKSARKVLMPRSVHPAYRETVRTIVRNQGIETIELAYDARLGHVAPAALECAACRVAIHADDAERRVDRPRRRRRSVREHGCRRQSRSGCLRMEQQPGRVDVGSGIGKGPVRRIPGLTCGSIPSRSRGAEGLAQRGPADADAHRRHEEVMTRFGTLHACHAAKPGKPRLRPIAECSPRRGRRAHRCQLLDDEQRGQPVAIAGMQVQPGHHFQDRGWHPAAAIDVVCRWREMRRGQLTRARLVGGLLGGQVEGHGTDKLGPQGR